jgi:hypothetical protein
MNTSDWREVKVERPKIAAYHTVRSRRKTFLLKVHVIGQHFSDAAVSHRADRNTIREAVPFVQPSAVKGETSLKRRCG